MEDWQLVELFHCRSETAIARTAEKYGRYCFRIAWNILGDGQDSEECVNDAYLRAWNAMPPKRPENLAAFLGRITRNLALDRRKHCLRAKRGGGQAALALDELAECIPGAQDVVSGDEELVGALNAFLAGLPEKKRQIFVRRYWHLSSIREIAADFSMREGSVRSILARTRRELKLFLERSGIVV